MTSVRSSNMSIASDVTNSSENFTTMSREFNQLVLAGLAVDPTDSLDGYHQGSNGIGNGNGHGNSNNLDRIGEEEGEVEETNPLAIVPDNNPIGSPWNGNGNRNGSSLGLLMRPNDSNSNSNSNNSCSNSNCNGNSSNSNNNTGGEVAVHRVKKEEVDTKIAAWQTAKIAKINNRFKREDAVISGRENEQVHKASSWMKKVEVKKSLFVKCFIWLLFFVNL